MNISALIPIRFRDCCKDDGSPKYILQDKPLWEWTIEQTLEEEALKEVIVAYDDIRFENHLKKWEGKIIKFLRPSYLSEKEVSLFQVLNFIIRNFYNLTFLFSFFFDTLKSFGLSRHSFLEFLGVV